MVAAVELAQVGADFDITVFVYLILKAVDFGQSDGEFSIAITTKAPGTEGIIMDYTLSYSEHQ